MKKLLMLADARRSSGSVLKTVACLLIGIALVVAFWTVTTPAAKARDVSPADLIQEQLPPQKTMRSASKADLTNAICAAVKRNRKLAAQIVRAAIEARPEMAGDAVATGVRCAGADNCERVGEIVAAALAANSGAASAITEGAMTASPGCAEAIQAAAQGGGRGDGGETPEGEGNFDNAPTNVNPPPGSVGGGGGFDPQEGKCTVCHNDNNPHEIRIPCSQVPKYLSNHPGDYEGACQATPTVNK